jgi:colanic acid/amylovoran biosynthesis glycosyltransferase
MPRLLMIAPAPVIEKGAGKLTLDVKFVEGMRIHVEQWDGPVTCILKRGATDIPFGMTYDSTDLGFDLEVISSDDPITVDGLQNNDLIFAGADMHDVLHLASPNHRPPGTKLVYSIEYDLDTRMQIASLDKTRSLLRKFRTKIWLVNQERRLRTALRNCDGIQANGYPAFAAYSSLNKHSMLYLDGRMENAAMATPDEQSARAVYLKSGAPLRIVHSGRLEPMKGGQDIIPVAKALRKSGINFTLDIFGSGSLTSEIEASITTAGLSDVVHMHGAVNFNERLVPFFRQNADLFLSCHLQSDPSCTYLESMGCGIPVAGYQNKMLKTLAKKSGGGWAVPVGKVGDIADQIAKLDSDRMLLIKAGQQGLEFAKKHSFQAEFHKRMKHLSGFVS